MGAVWRETKTGDLFHDECFEKDESKEGFTAVTTNEVDDKDSCKSCGGAFDLEDEEEKKEVDEE